MNKKIILITSVLFFTFFSSVVFAEEQATSTQETASSTPEAVEVIEEIVVTTTENIVFEEIATSTEEVATPTIEVVVEETTEEVNGSTEEFVIKEEKVYSGESSIDISPFNMDQFAQEIIDKIKENLPQQIQQTMQQPQPQQSPPQVSFDPATALSTVKIFVIMPDGNSPPFPVFITFVGVGNKNFGGRIDANGELTVKMPTGRYYTELMVINTEYISDGNVPSFFLESNEERDLGVIKLMLKPENSQQDLQDISLEQNVLSQAGETNGIGKILVLIIKLLLEILEEIKTISVHLLTK